MSEEQLITKQQLEIEDLKIEVANFKEARKKVHGILYSIGAPLNDNILQFNNKQMGVLFEIEETINF